MEDKNYMLRAIELAKRGIGYTSPNPLVGAVIVKNGRIIGEGYHAKYGDLHAERNAIKNLTESANGATIYVTLEPCCHHGKQPPCTEAILESDISKVVIGSRDPNPLVAGKGVEFLRKNNIEVVEDFMRAECDELNPVFFHYITSQIPYIVLKYAMTMDGKIATTTGESQWITGDSARNEVHNMRHKYRGILVGINTVLQDNPMLNTRIQGLRSPVRIICDSKLSIPMDCNIVKTAKEYETIIACCSDDAGKINALEAAGITILKTPEKDGHVDLQYLLKKLGEQKIDSILVEGGGEINFSFIKEDLVNQVDVFIGAKIFGGTSAKGPVAGIGISSVADAKHFELANISQFDQDVLIEYRRAKCLQE